MARAVLGALNWGAEQFAASSNVVSSRTTTLGPGQKPFLNNATGGRTAVLRQQQRQQQQAVAASALRLDALNLNAPGVQLPGQQPFLPDLSQVRRGSVGSSAGLSYVVARIAGRQASYGDQPQTSREVLEVPDVAEILHRLVP